MKCSECILPPVPCLGLRTGDGITTWGPWKQEGSALISVLHSLSQWGWPPDRNSSSFLGWPWGELSCSEAIDSRHYRMRSLHVGSVYRGQCTACLTPCQKFCLSHFKILWEAGLNSLSHREHFEVSKQSSDMTTEVFGVVIGNLNCTGVRCNSVKSLAWWGPGICQGMLYQKMYLVVKNISRFPWIWPGPCMAFNICRLRHPVVFPCTACLTLQGRGLPFRQTRETPFGSFSLATWKDEVDSKSAPKAGTAPPIWWMIFLPHSGPLLDLESFALLLPLQGEV